MKNNYFQGGVGGLTFCQELIFSLKTANISQPSDPI